MTSKGLYLRVKDVAKELDVSVRHVYRLIEAGRLRVVNIGVQSGHPVYRILRQDLDAFKKTGEDNLC